MTTRGLGDEEDRIAGFGRGWDWVGRGRWVMVSGGGMSVELVGLLGF